MDFARGKLGGGLEIERTTDIPLQPVLKIVADERANTHRDRVVNLSFAFADPIDSDCERIGQLFSNLLANALTHGASDKPIRVEATGEDGIFRLPVANAGQPISPVIMKDLFLPSAAATPIAAHRGWGLASSSH